MKASTLFWLALLAGCCLDESGGATRDNTKEDGSWFAKEPSEEAPESSELTDEQRQRLVDNFDRRMEKIRRIEGKLEGLREKYPRANMFAIVQEQLDEIKAQLDAV